MSNSEIIIKVIQQLRGLFLDGGELKGYDDWDRFFGCISALQGVAADLSKMEAPEAETRAAEPEEE